MCRSDGDPATDWATLVVDTIYRLPKRYAPDDLVSTGKAGLNTGYKVSRVIIDDLRAMAKAARARRRRAGRAVGVPELPVPGHDLQRLGRPLQRGSRPGR